ncbi:Tetratricopeptide-like helical domain superfamily [Sesbania bispinosa]|nr:Tetratricopeptide-like helical domain superfamily [Sesbania bispinosa]
MYMNVGEKRSSTTGFDLMQERTVVSWNTMINGYFRYNCAEEALRVYNRMMDEGVEPDCATMVSVFPACGLFKECGAWERVLDIYVKCGQMKDAYMLVNEIPEKDVVTWTTLINGYILNGDATSALMLCRMMQWEGVKPNSVSIASLLSACGSLVSLNHGKCLHAWAIRQKLESEVIVENCLD